MGPFKYLTKISPLKAEQLIMSIMSAPEKNSVKIKNGSFIQELLFPEGQHSFIALNLERPTVNKEAKKW